jgi:hypothetical protein
VVYSDIAANGSAFSGAVITYDNNRIVGKLGNAPTAAGAAPSNLGQQ